MNDLFSQVIGNNEVRDYLWVIGVIFAVWLLNKFISRHLAGFLCRVFRPTWKTFDRKTFIDLIIPPLGAFLIVTVSIVALYRLSFPPALNITLYKYPLRRILLSIGTLVQIGAFAWLLLRTIDFIARALQQRADLTPTQSDNQLIVFFRDFLKVIIGIIGIMLILHFAFGYDIGSLLTGLSIVGAAIALALRESLENLIASFVIFFDKPFTIGDFVKVQNVAGNVESIGLRSTRVRTSDKSYVTVPNKQMVDSILDNVSKRSQIRGELVLHISLSTPPAKIEQLISETKGYLSTIGEVSGHTVLFNDIKLQAFIVFVEFFTPPLEWGRFTAIRQGLNFFVLQTMEKLEIRIAAEVSEIAISPS
jgi:MscS family membrane protein